MTPNAQHKRAERQRRRDAGDRRLEVWIGKSASEDLTWIVNDRGYTPEMAISIALHVYRQTMPR